LGEGIITRGTDQGGDAARKGTLGKINRRKHLIRYRKERLTGAQGKKKEAKREGGNKEGVKEDKHRQRNLLNGGIGLLGEGAE